MSTIIYDSPIFGPVKSRRLGISLGINLMPNDGKICTFDCIYCECGFNKDYRTKSPFPTREEVAAKLEAKLKTMKETNEQPDVLTFAGNGEPTANPQFAEIIDDTIRLRNQYCPKAKVSVLSNATFIHRTNVHNALMKVDNNILKLDTIDNKYINKVDRPTYPTYRVSKIVEEMKTFNGRLIVPWLDAVKTIAPREVMIYTIDRETPDPNLKKATKSELDAICERVKAMGIPCSASY